MRALFVGDVHGNINYVRDILESALVDGQVDKIIQLGDLGYWEQIPEGVAFLDVMEALCEEAGLDVYWLDGNHECHPLLRSEYGPGGPKHKLTAEGFWVIRPHIFYLPRGVHWTWDGIRFAACGGAYSIDKSYRLGHDDWRYKQALKRAALHVPPLPVPSRDPYRSWWPEEDITDAEIDRLIGDGAPVDVLLTHDKPMSAALPPGSGLLPIEECIRGQKRLQQAVDALKPKLLLHGHLHMRYRSRINLDNGTICQVEGLAHDSGPWYDSHLIIDLEEADFR